MSVRSMPFGGQKRASDPLELELQTAVNCCVGAGNQTQVSARVANALSC